jgi:hypothetical protein
MPRSLVDAIARDLRRHLPRRTAIAGVVGGLALGAGLTLGRRALALQATPPAEGEAFIVIRRYQLLPGNSMDALVKLVNDGFVPIISKIPGFKEYLLVDAAAGAHLSVSIFEDESGAEASTRDAADWAAANVAELIEGPPEVIEGWVRIHVSAASVTETV